MTDGRGWHGDPEGHRDAAETRWERNWRTYLRRTRGWMGEAWDGDVDGWAMQLVRAKLAFVMMLFWAAVTIVWLPFEFAWDVTAWVWTQAASWWASVKTMAGKFSIDQLLIPGFRDLANWLIGILPDAFGLRSATPWDQFRANVALAFLTFLSGFVTAGAAWALIAVWTFLAAYAVFFRTTEDGGKIHERVTQALPIKRDYDIPFWRSE